VTQLRAVVLPALQHAGGDPAEVVAQMFESILDCSAKAIGYSRAEAPTALSFSCRRCTPAAGGGGGGNGRQEKSQEDLGWRRRQCQAQSPAAQEKVRSANYYIMRNGSIIIIVYLIDDFIRLIKQEICR
jgi:hypothetical protein